MESRKYVTYAGIGAPFNTSLQPTYFGSPESDGTITILFMYFHSFLSDSTISIPSPISTNFCDPNDLGCLSYILPGQGNRVIYRNDSYWVTSIASGNSNASTFVVDDAPGYLMEFAPVYDNITFAASECLNSTGPFSYSPWIRFCLKNDGSDVLSGNDYRNKR
jgi:hypothetical protein